VLLRGRIGGLDERPIVVAFAKIAAAALVMAAAAVGAEAGLRHVLPGVSISARLTHVLGGIAAGLVVLALAARLLRIREFDQAVAAVLRRDRGTGT
jgi:hypothetical protein